MGWKVWIALGALVAIESDAGAFAPLNDRVTLNIGVNCRWEWDCMTRQRKAMNQAQRYVASKRIPLWRLHLCNRNARRTRERMDWIGFNSCIRNGSVGRGR